MPEFVPEPLVRPLIDVIVHLTRLVDGTRRVSKITEVQGMESEVITLQDIFLARPMHERTIATETPTFLQPLENTGLQPHFRHKMAAHGVALPEEFWEPDRLVGVGANGNGKRGRL